MFVEGFPILKQIQIIPVTPTADQFQVSSRTAGLKQNQGGAYLGPLLLISKG